ncbi:MAG: hypothetical protein P8Z37_01575 [Acidobacteriota bacterium]
MAVWMLALLCTVATAAALWTVEDTPGSTGEACLEYQDPETLDGIDTGLFPEGERARPLPAMPLGTASGP